jgi:ABC-2 type transport system ATP-binding protein
MITAEELTKQRGGRAVVSDVTFRCEPGTSTAFLGPTTRAPAGACGSSGGARGGSAPPPHRAVPAAVE